MFTAIIHYTIVITIYAGDIPYHESHGFGTQTEGGLSGTVIRVTNLNKSGPGSLKAACEDSGIRVVVFDVGGVIDLDTGTIAITHPYLTVAGQTAPFPGITLIRGSLSVRTHDVVIQHIAVRPGDMTIETDAISAGDENSEVHHVVFDHCSASWATDENLSLRNASNNHDITLYKCLIAEGLNFLDHSCGSLIYGGIDNLSIIGCLYAHNVRRNPRINNGTAFVIANNIFYNWGIFTDNSGSYANCVHLRNAGGSFVGNLALGGNNTQDPGTGLYFVRGHDGMYTGEGYFEGNLLRHAYGQSVIGENDHLITKLDSKPVWPEGFVAKPVSESIHDVLRTVGARAADRDPTDDRIVRSVIHCSGNIIDRQSDVEGYPQYEMTSRSLIVPDDTTERRKWLDSLSAAIDTDDSLDTSPLDPVITNTGEQQTFQDHNLNLTCYPNPHESGTLIKYVLSKSDRIVLKIYDLTGREIATPVNGYYTTGEYEVNWNSAVCPAGIYLCRIEAGNYSVSQKIISRP